MPVQNRFSVFYILTAYFCTPYNIILLSTPVVPKWPFLWRCSDQNNIYTVVILWCYMPCPSHPSPLLKIKGENKVWLRSSSSCNFLNFSLTFSLLYPKTAISICIRINVTLHRDSQTTYRGHTE